MSQCPPEVARILLDILATGIFQVRNSRCDGESRQHINAADHLHNLPALLRDYSADLLVFYWTVERPCFINRCDQTSLEQFQPLWERLAEHIPVEHR